MKLGLVKTSRAELVVNGCSVFRILATWVVDNEKCLNSGVADCCSSWVWQAYRFSVANNGGGG